MVFSDPDWERPASPLKELFAHASDIQVSAADLGDTDIEAIMEDSRWRFLALEKLIVAFETSPGHLIDGPRGVASQLGLSREGTYCILVELHLDPVDLKPPLVNVDHVLRKSGLDDLAARIAASHGQYLQFVEANEK